ncbi:MFS transporter [Nakamurella flava]|uniref:MFS transporter n=1 Tax=Nakamurella flava TaxID=2576308 RepID=UPI00140A81CE|nr:MFS transporter [Nakamurella flava]
MTAASPSPSVKRPARPALVLATVCAALGIISIDVTVLHVAAPSIQRALDPTPGELLWIIDVFPFVVAPLLLSAGVLGDRFGRRLFLVVGLAVFGLASGWAAFAGDPTTLILARAVSAVGGSMAMPSTMSMIRVAYPDRATRVRAVAIWSMTSAGAAAAGPVIGGFLVEHFWWGSVFLVNVPVCAVVIVAALAWTRESRSDRPARFDLVSQLLAVGAVLAACLAANELADHAVLVSAVSAVVSAGLVVAFLRRQRAAMAAGVQPTLDLGLFADRSFSAALVAIFLAMFAIVGLDLQFAQHLQLSRGLAAFTAALMLLPLALATMAGGFCSPWLLRRLGHRRTISGGLVVAGLALVPVVALGGAESFVVFGICTGVVGFSVEVVAVAANDLIISSAGEHEVGGAAALEEIAYDLGGGFGVAVLGAVAATAVVAGGDDGFVRAVGGSVVVLVAVGLVMAGLLRRADVQTRA